ncbi:hypothetical protein ACLOJK_000799 [Asimina triloba]
MSFACMARHEAHEAIHVSSFGGRSGVDETRTSFGSADPFALAAHRHHPLSFIVGQKFMAEIIPHKQLVFLPPATVRKERLPLRVPAKQARSTKM